MSSLRVTFLRALLALGLSFALWTFVSFSQNPEESVSFTEQPLEIVGLQDGLVIVDANGLPNAPLPTVDITLRTDRFQRASLRPVDIRAVLDLTDLGPGEHSVPVNVRPTRSNLSFGIAAGDVEPTAVPIRLEQLITATVPIDLQIIGSPPFSFERGSPQITFSGEPISVVLIAGPQGRVERVKQVAAVANIEQLRASYLAPLSLTPLDEADQPVEGVTAQPGTVTVLIPISSVVGLKLVPVAPAIIGQPAPGYAVQAVEVNPPLIALTGSSGLLDRVDSLRTRPIDLDGARAEFTSQIDLVFPIGTSPGENEPTAVQITVRVVPIALPFQATLPAAVVLNGLGGGLSASLSVTTVNIRVIGSSASLTTLSQNPLQAILDVANLGPGTYQVPVRVTLPSGVTLVGEAPTVSVALRAPPTPVPTEPTPPTGTPPPNQSPTTSPNPAEPSATADPAPSATADPAPSATADPAPSPTP